MAKHFYFVTEDQLSTIETALGKLPGSEFLGSWQLIQGIKALQEMQGAPSAGDGDRPRPAAGPPAPIEPPAADPAPKNAEKTARGAAATTVTPSKD